MKPSFLVFVELAAPAFVEGRTLRRFYKENTVSEYRWGDGQNFCAEVGGARLAFEDEKLRPH